MLGILGGMGPAATADFLAKLVALTPADRDQDHIPLLLACLPQLPDRSAAILGRGPSPLPGLRASLQILCRAGAKAIVMPCNSSHHWHAELQAEAKVPLLHIADASLEALPRQPLRVGLMATRGALASGFYQRRLEAAGHRLPPIDEDLQQAVDTVIAAIKAAEMNIAAAALREAWLAYAAMETDAVVMACTEIPLAARELPPPPFLLVDSNLELARSAVAHATAQGWHRPC